MGRKGWEVVLSDVGLEEGGGMTAAYGCWGVKATEEVRGEGSAVGR